LVSADHALPIINLGYGDWIATNGSGWQNAGAVLMCLGWIFATLAAATFTSRAIRE
jgi:hypothetical protein